jgi:hypothetical protein
MGENGTQPGICFWPLPRSVLGAVHVKLSVLFYPLGNSCKVNAILFTLKSRDVKKESSISGIVIEDLYLNARAEIA